jgi:hypothetical protein
MLRVGGRSRAVPFRFGHPSPDSCPRPTRSTGGCSSEIPSPRRGRRSRLRGLHRRSRVGFSNTGVACRARCVRLARNSSLGLGSSRRPDLARRGSATGRGRKEWSVSRDRPPGLPARSRSSTPTGPPLRRAMQPRRSRRPRESLGPRKSDSRQGDRPRSTRHGARMAASMRAASRAKPARKISRVNERVCAPLHRAAPAQAFEATGFY